MINQKEYQKNKKSKSNKRWRDKNPEYYKLYYNKNAEKISEYNKQWRKNNPEKEKEYRKNNSEKIKDGKKRYYLDNKERILKKYKQYREENKDKARIYQKKYREENYEKKRQYNKQYAIKNKDKKREYYLNNKEGATEWRKQWRRKQVENNDRFVLNHRVSGAIYKSLKRNKNGYHWEDLVGYTLDDLKDRLIKTMPEGYCWNDYLNGKLHIDHIIPISVFNYTKPEHTDFKRCWALNNLRLFPARENLIKANKISSPLQPALQI